MKKLLGIALLIGWGLLTIASNSSCESSPTASAPDTIKLSTVTVLAPGVTDTNSLRLTCGCAFVLRMDNTGGDTSAFRIVDLDTMTMKKTPHHLAMKVKPETPSGTYNAWYAYSAIDHNGGTDYDTLQLYTNF